MRRRRFAGRWIASRTSAMRLRVALLLSITAAIAPPAGQLGQTIASSPGQPASDPYEITTVCTVIPLLTGRRVAVSTGAELQRALDEAVAGDTIALAAGATFEPPADGSFILRNRPL